MVAPIAGGCTRAARPRLTGVKRHGFDGKIVGIMGEILELLWPHGDSELLDRRRAEAIADRVRAFAQLFAVLTIAGAAADAVAFERDIVVRLFLLRLGASAAFAALAFSCRKGPCGLRAAEARLALLFLVPALLYLASAPLLERVPHAGVAGAVASLYAFAPFVLAAGIAAFPLAAVESSALATIALLTEAWALASGARPIEPLTLLDAFWLLVLIAVVATFSAMSQLRLLDALARQAMRDPLTGCYRRESGTEFLEIQFQVAARHATPLALLFADLDHFKDVNDRFGHDEGDRVLAAAAEGLRRMTRESDLVLRWGGEEFVVVLPHTTLNDAIALLDRLREHGVGRLPDGRPVTLSIGIAECLADSVRSARELVELADRRMYLAKRAGRNRYVDSAGREPCELLDVPRSAVSR